MKVRLSELCTIQYGFAFDSASFTEDTSFLPLVRIRDVKRGYSETYYCGEYPDEYILHSGDLLIGMDGEFNIARWKSRDALLNQRVCKVVAKDGTDEEYLRFALSRSLKTIEEKTAFVTVKHLSAKELNKLELNIPDYTTQCIISKTLSSIERIIELRRIQLQHFDDLIKARFVEISNDNKSSNLLSEFITAFSAQRCGERNLPVLSITKADGIVFQDEKFKKRIASTDASTYKVIPRGKLVQGIHIDERNFAIQNITDEGIVSPAYKVWSVDVGKAIPEVLAYALRSDYAMAYISSKFTGSVKRRESISNSDFLAMPINMPPLEAQKRIYKFMQQIDKSKMIRQKR